VPQACRLYGLGVEVDAPIAALQGLPAHASRDVRVRLEADPPLDDRRDPAWSDYYLSPERDDRGVHHVRVSRRTDPDLFRFEYEDGTRIHVDAGGENVWARGASGASLEDTATYLLGPILGFVLQLRGVTCLHASAVAIGDRAIAIAGPAGSGKSSLAAALARRGHAVLADDLVALEDHGDRFSISPGYARVRLWPSSVGALFGSDDALPRITPNWDKRFLSLDGERYRFQDEAMPLEAIYVLGDRDLPGGPRVDDIAGREALMALVANTYTNHLLDRPMRAREFEALARIARAVRIRGALAAARFERIDALCEAIEADV
jgi:hypothetical protein